MKKILVIEDDPFIRSDLVEILEEDFDVVSSEHGLMGALWAQEHIPDLILCDVMMPEVDGYDVLSALRGEPMTATIPFIFLTALADKADIRRGMEIGADDYLTKPFTREELLGAIKTRFAKHEVVMQQYTAEHQRAEALQQKVEELQQSGDLLKQLQQESRLAVPKLNLAIQMLQSLQPGVSRDRCLEILQDVCSREIALLNRMPDLQNLLTPENAQLLRQLNIVSNGRDFGV